LYYLVTKKEEKHMETNKYDAIDKRLKGLIKCLEERGDTIVEVRPYKEWIMIELNDHRLVCATDQLLDIYASYGNVVSQEMYFF
jgi:hypothetical protein